MPGTEHRRRRILDAGRVHVANDDRGHGRRREPLTVQTHERVPRHGFHRFDCPLHAPAVGMRRSVELLKQCLGRANERVVVVLADGGDRLTLARCELRVRNRGVHDHIAEK